MITSHEEFVRVWQQAEHANDVAKAFEISVGYAYIFAARLRKLGVNLKKFHPRFDHKSINVDALNAIISEKA